MGETLLDRQVGAVRAFNRFYTRRIGLLEEHLLGSDFSLPEMRILWELSSSDQVSASWLQQVLRVDAGYVSRLLAKLRAAGLVDAKPDAKDRRIRRLRLTEKGKRVFAPLDRKSDDEVRRILEGLSTGERGAMVGSMSTLQAALERRPLEGGVVQLRAPRPGDFGWVVERHGVLYAQEYGWDATFEGLVAGIVAGFARHPRPARQACWIAEREGERLGSIFLVEKSSTIGQLRLLLVEPSARGRGVGRALVRECVRTATAMGYRKLILWTNDVLHAARRIYVEEGFKLVKQEKHHSWGHDLVGQYWELGLKARAT